MVIAVCFTSLWKDEEANRIKEQGSQYAAPVGNNETIFSYFLR